MKKLKVGLMLIVLVMLVSSVVMAEEDLKTYSIFNGIALPEYDGDTILGDIIREETGVKLEREYLVGDLETKVGLMISSGDYPDMVQAAHFTNRLVDAGALIPLEELIDKHAPNIKKYYAKHLEAMTQEDGHIYSIPQQAIPFEPSGRRYPSVGFYINKAVLKDAGWPVVKTFDEFFELVADYQEKNPTYKGENTIGYLTLFDEWRNFATLNGPMHLMGYPNEGGFIPTMRGEEPVVEPYYGGRVEKYYYSKLNEMYNEGVVDGETFVDNYDKYIEKLSSGRVLATHNQHWQVQDAQDVLVKEEPDRILVPFPVTYAHGVEEHMRDTPYIQSTQGTGITTACDDPVGAIKYLDYLVANEQMIMWGIEGEHYEVDEDGKYYRTPEQQELFDDPEWVRHELGTPYFRNSLPSLIGLDENGNSYMPDRQASMIYEGSSKTEKEVMDAYGIKSFTEFYNDPKPTEEVPWFPLWTITLESGGPADIESTRMSETLREYVPKLVMAESDNFEDVWAEYTDNISGQMDEQIKAFQERIDWRVENWSVDIEE
ncbi:MAG: extracellular solute-binding protein [Halothermotrichaceae bacterium]